jgi:DNA replication factor GINS
MLTYETIRKIFEDEKMSQGLTRLPEDFFEEVKKYLEKKSKLVRTESDRWELDSIKRRLRTIFEMRERKIINAALSYVRSGEIPQNMIPEEKKFFDSVVENIKKFQREREERFEEKKEKKLMVTILSEVPAFVGTNLQNYGPFKRGDITTLPEPNANLLIEKRVAERIELKDKDHAIS